MGHKKKAIVTKKISPKKHVDDLRKRAEKKVTGSKKSIGEMSAPEIQKLIHELSVHKIELEMQNEALRRSQAETAESQYRYSDLYNFAPVGYFTLDRKGHIIEANVTGASLLGAEKRSLAKQPFQRFILPVHFSIFQSHLQKVHESQGKQICRLKLTGKDVTPFDALIDTIAVIDGEGKFAQYRSSVTDITEITRAEEALRESEERYRYLVQHAPTGIYEVDFTTRKFLSVNDAMCQYTGYTTEEFLSMDPIQLLTEESQKSFTQRHAKVLAGEPVTDNVEFQIKRKDGSEFWALLNTRYSYGPNNRILSTVIAHDVTERRQAEDALHRSEENFRRSLHESPLGVRIVTIEGETIYANRAILDFCGCDSIEELKAAPIIKRYIPKSFAELQTRKEKRDRGDYSPSEYEISIARKDGEVRHLHVFRKEVLWDGEKQFQVLYNDITERKQAEEALRKSEEKFVKTFQSNPACVGLSRLSDGLVIEANEALLNLLGYSKDEFIGHTIPELGVWNDLRDRERLVQTLTTEGRSANQEYWFRTKTGELLLCNQYAETIQIDNEPHIIFTFFDMTERKRVEETLRESEARFAKIFNASPVAIAITRLNDSRLIDVNLAWQRATGYSREEVIGHTPIELNTWVNRGERDRLISMMLEQGTVRDFLFQLRHKSGTVLEMLMSAELIELEGERYVLSLAQDITERRRTEEALRERDIQFKKLSSWVPGMIYQFTRRSDGTYFVPFATETIKDIFGCSPQDVREDFSPITRVILSDDLDKVFGSIEYSAEHLTTWTCEYRVQIRGQSIRWLLGNSTPEKLADGSTTWYGFNTDVTERRQAADALNRSEENFRRSLDESPLGVRIVNEEGETIYANGAILDIYGYDSIEEMRSTPAVKRYTPESFAEYQIRREKRKRGDDTPSEYDIGIIRKDGEVRHLHVFRKEVRWNGERQFQVLYNDITDRKRAEEALQEKERKIVEALEFNKTILNTSSIGILIYRESGQCIYANEAAATIGGTNVAGLLEQNFHQLQSWKKSGMCDTALKALCTGTEQEMEIPVTTTFGKDVWLSLRFSSFNSEGQNHLLVFTQDIAERKLAEERLHESEVRYRMLFDNAADGIALADAETGELVDCNQGLCRMLEWNKAELVGQAQSILHPPEAVIEGFSQTFQQHQTVEPEIALEDRLLSKSGKLIPVEIQAARIEINGRDFLIGIFRDITERKRLEEILKKEQQDLKLIIDSSPIIVFYKDKEGKFIRINKAFIEALNLSSEEDIVGKTVFDLYSNKIAEGMTNDDQEVIKSGHLKLNIIEQYESASGIRWAQTDKIPICDKNGIPFGLIGFSQDITERKQAEEAIKKSHEQLRTLAGRLQSVREEQRKEFAREIHDQLGGAMAGMKIDLSFLVSSAPKSWHTTKRDSFLSKVHDMSKLIDETIGTVRRLVTELRPSILDDFGLLAALEWQLWEFQKRTGIQSEFVSTLEDVNIDEELSITVFRIFQEALTNVARHANATNVIATLYKEADSLVLKVEDNGKGISENDIHNTKSIGLIGMRERALFLGGTVNFSGEPSRGTTVSVQFPFGS